MISSIVKNNVLSAYRVEKLTIPQISNRYGINQKQIEKIIFPNGRGSVSLGFSRVIVKKHEKVLIPVDSKIMDKKEIQRQAGIKAAITRRKNIEEKLKLPKESTELTDSQRIERLETLVSKLDSVVSKLIKLIEDGIIKV